MNARIKHLTEQFDRNLGPTLRAAVIPSEDWNSVIEREGLGDTLHTPFGYTAPFRPRPPGFFLCFSPDLIVHQTNELTDEEFGAYLDALEMHIHLHIVHFGRPVEEIERLVDSVTADLAPSTLRLLNRVQMGALDG